MSSLKILRKDFLSELAAALEPKGFVRKGQGYRRSSPIGHEFLYIQFLSYPGYFAAILSIGVRHEAVETYLENNGLVTQGQPSDWLGCTVLTLLDNIVRKPVTWVIFNEDDVSSAVGGVLDTLNSVVFPIFKRLSSAEEMLNVLITDVPENRYLAGYFDTSRAREACVLAAILDQRAIFNNAVDKNTERLQSQIASGVDHNAGGQKIDVELNEFLQFADDIRDNWVQLSKADTKL